MRTGPGIAVCVALALAACGVPERHRLGSAEIALSAPAAPVAVAVADRRPHVLDGETGPAFLGILRSTYGFPADMWTYGRTPLAEAMGTALVASLRAAGGRARGLDAAAPARPEDLAEGLAPGERLLWVQLQEWKLDVWQQVTSHWDIVLSVHDATGRRLASERLTGLRGAPYVDIEKNELPPYRIRIVAQSELARQMETLLARPSVAAALAP